MTGAPPELVVEPDRIVDFEDLSVFAWMWNWHTANPYSGSTAKSARTVSGTVSVPLALAPGADGSLTIVSSRPLSFLNLRIDAKTIRDAGITVVPGGYWDSNGKGIALTRLNPDGSVELAAARLGSDAGSGGNDNALAYITMTRTGGMKDFLVDSAEARTSWKGNPPFPMPRR